MSKAENFWNRMANGYEREIDADFMRSIDTVRPYLKPEDVVLDFACATGLVSLEIADSVGMVHGIDISPKMIAIASEAAQQQAIDNVHFAHTTLFDARYTEGMFDVILAFNVLHLLEDRQKILQRIHALLKPGGVFISQTPSLGTNRSLWGMAQTALRTLGLVPHINMIKVPDLRGAIEASHFEILETAEMSESGPVGYLVIAKAV